MVVSTIVALAAMVGCSSNDEAIWNEVEQITAPTVQMARMLLLHRCA